MLKYVMVKVKYYYHLIQYRHHQLLQEDCLSEDLKAKLKIKAIYHNSMAIELSSQF